jgi:HK97 family phage prohead protease
MPKEAVISTPRLNSYGARVLTEGIDLEQYQKNPVLLYMHRRGRKEDMPIGIMENLRVEGDTLYGTPKFDDDTEDERNINKKWERGTLRMLSAGLDILEWSEEPALLVAGQTRPTITKSKLIEVSVVDIGANDDALQVGLYHEGRLLSLAAGEENAHLPLLTVSAKEDNEEQTPNNNQQKKMEKILLKLGLAPNATEDEAVAAIGKLQEEKSAMALARITDAVETAIKEKRITADKKEKYLSLGKTLGLADLNALFADMSPAQKPLDLVRPNGSGQSAGSATLTWASATPEQLKELRENNKEEYVRLYKENFGFAPEF